MPSTQDWAYVRPSFVGQEGQQTRANKLDWRNLHKSSSRWGEKHQYPPQTHEVLQTKTYLLNIKYCNSNIYLCFHVQVIVVLLSCPCCTLPPSKFACKGQRLLVQSWPMTSKFELTQNIDGTNVVSAIHLIEEIAFTNVVGMLLGFFAILIGIFEKKSFD